MPWPENPGTKDKLLLAAIETFAEKGYEAATVRAICKRAGSANLNAVNYYFGGKRQLYGLILEMMYAELGRRWEALAEELAPERPAEDRLRTIIRAYCEMVFGGGDAARAMARISAREMVSPSPMLADIVRRHLAPQNETMGAVLRDILGPGASPELIRDCGPSIFGQAMYYMFMWPVFSAVFPEHPGMEAYLERLVDHVHRFSLAGLKGLRDDLPA